MAVADLPPSVSATIQEVCPYYELEGDSSRRLLDQFGTAIVQWQDRPGVRIEAKDDTESINHVPFEKSGKIRVRFKMAGIMRPRVIDAMRVGEE